MTTIVQPSALGPDGVAEIADVLASVAGPVAVIAADLIIAEAALAPISADPFATTGLLVQTTTAAADVRVRHHVVMSVGSSMHDVAAPDHRFVGAFVVAERDRVAALAALRDAQPFVPVDLDPVQAAAVALVRAGMTCRAIELVDVPWYRDPVDVQAARADVGRMSAARIAQLQANRVDDGFFSTFVIRRMSKPITRVALRLGLSPNTITLASFAIGLAAAAFFAIGYQWALVIGAVLLQVSIVVDCVDGEVARATRRFSTLGAWLDASTDRVKEYVAYAGLAFGAQHVLGIDLWPLAIIMMVLQTVRHMTDYDFSRVQRSREARVEPRSYAERSDGAQGGTGGWSVAGAMEMSSRVNARSAVRWAKRAIHMPIGERWLVISVFAAVLGAAWALGALLVLGTLALIYVTSGRILRTLTWRGPAPHDAALLLARQADAGVLATALARVLPDDRWTGRWAWSYPALLRLFELGLVAVLSLLVYPDALVLGFWWVAVIAFHHYDVLYRAIQGQATPRWLTWCGLGWDGRSLLIVLAAIAGIAWFSGLLAVGIAVWSLLLVVIASAQWLRSMQ